MPYRDSYASQPLGPALTPWVRRLLIGLTAVFLALFLSDDVLRLDLTRYLMFVPSAVLRQPWSVLTFPLVHRRPLELLFILLTLFFFGGPLEQRWGGPGFLRFLGASVAGGVLLAVLLALVWPGMAGMPLVGFEGAIYGMLLALALYWPDMEINIWGIIPVKAKWLTLISALIGFIIAVQSGGFGLAHLGAFGTAFLYLKSPWAPRAWGELPARSAPRKVQQRAVSAWMAKRPAAAAPAEEVEVRSARSQRELFDDVDKILDKISAEGLSALSDDERRRLDEVSRRYRTN